MHHPLDHTLAECQGHPGGRRRHVQNLWRYQWREQLMLLTLHVFGRHTWTCVVMLNQNADEGAHYIVRCRGCNVEPTPETVARLVGNVRNDREVQRAVSTLAQFIEHNDDTA